MSLAGCVLTLAPCTLFMEMCSEKSLNSFSADVKTATIYIFKVNHLICDYVVLSPKKSWKLPFAHSVILVT